MLTNFFKIAWRNLNRNKGFSILNISGLAIGMASSMLILLWIHNELSFDSQYPNSDRLYLTYCAAAVNNGISCWDNTPKILGPTLKNVYPEVDRISRLNWDATILFKVGDKKLNVKGTMADPDFLKMFNFPMVKGNGEQALNRENDIVITEKLSKKLFGSEEPIGKNILLDNKYNFIVCAVMKDLPNNTKFEFEYLLPWSYMRSIHMDDSTWTNYASHNYILLKPNTDIVSFNKKIVGFIDRYDKTYAGTKIFLYPVSRLHLYSNFVNGRPEGGKIEMVKIFMLIAGFILLVACINFMNMSTARSEKRAKEVGIRKVSGALRRSLIVQFICESLLISGIAGLLALLMVTLSLPAFNSLTHKSLFIESGNIFFWISIIGFILFTGFMAGSYPAFFLSSFKPVSVLKGSFKKSEALVTPRRVLVILQFTLAIIFIISTMIIQQQIKYAQSRDAGYEKNKLLYVNYSGDIEKNYDFIKAELLRRGIASSVTKTSSPLTENWSSSNDASWTGKNKNNNTEFNFFNVDDHIVKTAGLQLVSGRDMDLRTYLTDSNAVILNEAAVREMGFKTPVGQIIDRGLGAADWHVIGVVKDFIMQSPCDPIRPIIIQGAKASWYFHMVHIRLSNTYTTNAALTALEKLFKQFNPGYPFEFHFTDEEYDRKFSDDKTTGLLSALFAGLTIFISCLGLFGLSAYMAEKRIKEIGVRKILGASVSAIAGLLSKDFIRLVLIAIFIATPVAWMAMDKWLAGYIYHIRISPWIFVVSGLLSVLIAVFTVSFQAIKAAMANPVKSLRSE